MARVKFEQRGGVGIVTFSSPERMNAYDMEMAKEFFEALSKAASSSDIRCLVITGEGRAFCAGGDVKYFGRLIEGKEKGVELLPLILHGSISQVRRMPKPVISAVNGVAAGAGIGLALAADLVYAVEGAQFVFAYPNVGLSPDGGATFLLTRELGYHRTMELMLTGKVLSAEEAKSYGLVNEVFREEGFMENVFSIAEKIASGPTAAFARGKELIASAYFEDMETQMERERLEILASMKTRDFREGVTAFIQKRKPDFKGE